MVSFNNAVKFVNGRRDRTGDIYGYLTVMEYAGSINKKTSLWKCICKCGNVTVVKGGNLNSGNTTSCGCYKVESSSVRSLKHGESGTLENTTEYRSWQSMKSRCYNKANAAYSEYGGRGISVCERWLHSYENFIEDMGRKPSLSHSIDRYPNNNGNYEPGNCRWATKSEQSKNRRSNKYYEYNGVKKNQKDWANEVGADNRQFHKMLKRKSFEQTYTHFKKRQLI